MTSNEVVTKYLKTLPAESKDEPQDVYDTLLKFARWLMDPDRSGDTCPICDKG